MIHLTLRRPGTGLLLMLMMLLPATLAMAAEQSGCSSLRSLQMIQGRVDSTESIAAGQFNPGSGAQARLYQELPAFCRVTLTLTPSADSDIRVEVWLPASDWNGKYLAVGNGAFNGSISYSSMSASLARGYATSSTDTGHTGNTAEFGLGHPEKVIDFGWRAVHEMSIAAKAVIRAYYTEAPRYAYWNGCSAGGRQAMKEAQRFPQDFDGIIAGAPGLDWTGRAVSALRLAQRLDANPAAQLTQEQRELVAAAALNACDADDKVADGIISKPAQCRFDPTVLACGTRNQAVCLNPEQITTVNMLYSSPLNRASGRAITGLLPGSELGWTNLGWTGSARATGLDQLRYLVYGDADWTIESFDFDTDVIKAEATDNDTLNALDPDLSAFINRGGKLIQYHGWSDPQISPANSTQYYERVSEQMGGRDKIHSSYRLFMAPGMAHCGGGNGPDDFDMVSALEAWVEQNQAPDQIIATGNNAGQTMTRPLCPWPEEAVYRGRGNPDNAANFSCRLP